MIGAPGARSFAFEARIPRDGGVALGDRAPPGWGLCLSIPIAFATPGDEDGVPSAFSMSICTAMCPAVVIFRTACGAIFFTSSAIGPTTFG